MNYYDSVLSQIPGDFTSVIIGLASGTLKIEGLPDITLSDCILDEPVDTKEMEPSAGQVDQMDALKIWPVSFSPKPPLGSVLVSAESGIYWTILAVRYKSQVKTWECHCRNLSVINNAANPGLNTAYILKAQWGKGRANEAKALWFGYVSGKYPPVEADLIQCRIQPSAEDAMIRFSGEWVKETYRVILQSQIPIDFAGAEWRVVDENGNRYRIISHFQAQRIDLLPVLICTRITEGQEWFNAKEPQPLPMP